MTANPTKGLSDVSLIGQTLKGSYRVYDEVGGGGFAKVYVGRHVLTNRMVAVKVLDDRHASDPALLERLEREARIAQSLNDPHVVKVWDVGEEAGRHFQVMEYVEGQSLADVVRQRGALPLAEAVGLVGQVLQALEVVAAAGIVHRDLKPHNLMLPPEGIVKLLDFGIARDGAAAPLTQTGTYLGTVHYMSPEQARGAPVDGRSDLYAVGILLYELLTGRVPFDAETPWMVVHNHLVAPIPSATAVRAGLPIEADALFRRALAKDPDARFQSPGELSNALDQLLDSSAGDRDRQASTSPVPGFQQPSGRPARRRASWLPPVAAVVALVAVLVIAVPKGPAGNAAQEQQTPPAVQAAPTESTVAAVSVLVSIDRATPSASTATSASLVRASAMPTLTEAVAPTTLLSAVSQPVGPNSPTPQPTVPTPTVKAPAMSTPTREEAWAALQASLDAQRAYGNSLCCS